MTAASELCLHEVFEAQVDRTPQAFALVCGERAMTYAELDRRANQLARMLKRRGAKAGEYVGIYFDRSELPIVSILACHKSGAAYVPIDPTYPPERIAHIVGELELTLCVTEKALSQRAGDLFAGVDLIVVDQEWPQIAQFDDSRLTRQESGASPEELAYVIYTSGTTGRPKGLMTEHRHVTRFVEAFNEVCATGPQDRVYQGFSLTFDGSVEEIWMAFSNGSVLVVPTRDAPRFGDELGQYLTNLRITYFSTVPTLLATFSKSVLSFRTVVLSGEVCPQELVNRWARPGRRVLNVYGPTEATVNTTVAECFPGQPVTIGKPLRGYQLHIVDENLRVVAPGQRGELVIGGETIARGYLKQPAQTSERFLASYDLDNGTVKRYYRTGDLVLRNDRGDVEFFGRIDGQVKIRGYRVELAEIESVLLEQSQVQAASVRLFERDSLQVLAAYVVAKPGTRELDRQALLSVLESRLPPYMVPGYLDVLTDLPRTTSGKVDRKVLPDPVTPLVRVSKTTISPTSELEHTITQVWSEVLGGPVGSVEDDFFLDLGGHSLLAARVATRLRERISQPVTVRAVYQFPTVRQLAAHLKPDGAPGVAAVPEQREPSSREVFDSTPRGTRLLTWTLQALSVYVIAALVGIPLSILFLLGLDWVDDVISTPAFVGLTVLLTVLTWPALLLFSVAAKWILIGRYKPGEHRLWSFYYWRWWLVNRISALSGASALSGTPALPLYYRLMGAKVGARCGLSTVQCSAWDLVSIGDDTSIGADTQLLGYRVENGMLRFGRVSIGNRCFAGIHSAFGLDVTMEDDASLDDQSLLPDGQRIPAGQGFRGSPAQAAEVRLPAGLAPRGSRARRALFAVAHILLAELMMLTIGLVPTLAFLGEVWLAFHLGGVVVGIALTAATVPVDVVLLCFHMALMKKLVLPRIEPGTYPVLSLTYLRKWLSDQLMASHRAVLLPVYTTLYLPPLLRLMGAKIAPRAEISSVWSFAPELVDVGPESFFADGSIIGGRRVHRGLFEVGVNRIGRRSFVGNSAILPVGVSLGDGCLLGVQSIPPPKDKRTPDGTEWLGSPAFQLTHRVKVEGFDPTVMFAPTFRLLALRGLIDGLRVVIPYYLLLYVATMFSAYLYEVHRFAGAGLMFALAPVVEFAFGLCAVLAVVVLKEFVMGTFKPEIKPLWSVYVWLNEMVNGAYESVVVPIITPLLGTPFVATFLRLMGCRIGRNAYLATTLFSEFDLVEVGDYAALNQGVVVQNHLFEDRVFKSSSLRIGDEASVGNMSVVLYDSEIESGATVGPLSLLMKGERLPGGTRWHGIPTMRARRWTPQPEERDAEVTNLADARSAQQQQRPAAIADDRLLTPALRRQSRNYA